MPTLTSSAQKILKAFHLVFASLWVGGAATLALKQFFINPADGRELYGITATMNFIDRCIIIPGAMGCLITGILYSTMTNWGWFKHRWVTVKWTICLYGVIFGTYPLGPWMESLQTIAGLQGLGALNDPTYMFNARMLMIFGTFQAVTLMAATIISALKPWKK